MLPTDGSLNCPKLTFNPVFLGKISESNKLQKANSLYSTLRKTKNSCAHQNDDNTALNTNPTYY